MFSLTKRQAVILLGVILLVVGVVLAGWELWQHNARQEASCRGLRY